MEGWFERKAGRARNNPDARPEDAIRMATEAEILEENRKVRRLPLRIKGMISVGSITADLKSVTTSPAGPSPATH